MQARLAVSLTALAFVGLAFSSLHRWRDKQHSLPACEMTYNYNSYLLQTSDLLPNHTGYSLHLYRELTIEYDPPAPPNVPVLFIPGNAGRHMQGRGFASECGRQWSAANKAAAAAVEMSPVADAGISMYISPTNLDWYMVDTKAQLSAYHGDVLEAQVEYVMSCLRYLCRTYNLTGAGGGVGIILVGHSMGGLVARAAAARAAKDPELGAGLVSLLLTLASPHQRPPLPSHPSLQRFYQRLAAQPLSVPLVSLAGGYNDTEVATALTSLQGVGEPELSLHTSLESVPGVWSSADHNCIVWCNQLTTKVATMLLHLAKNLRSAATEHAEASKAGGDKAVKDARAAAKQMDGLDAGIDEAFWRQRNALVMSHVRRTFVEPSLLHQLLIPPTSGRAAHTMLPLDNLAGSMAQVSAKQHGSATRDTAAATTSSTEVDLSQALDQAAGQQCRGANLAWYMQYVTPRTVPQPTLHIRHASIKDGLGKTGRLYLWPLNTTLYDQPRAAEADASGTATSDSAERSGSTAATGAGPRGARSWTLIVSASKPCTGFRVWLLRNSSSSVTDQLGRDVDVTNMAARLPPLHAAARQRVRVWSEAQKIMAGKDYEAAAAWVLRLPPALLQGASGIMVWLGEISMRKAFVMTAQLTSAAQLTPQALDGIPTADVGMFQQQPTPAASPPRSPAMISWVQLRALPAPLHSLVSWRSTALQVVQTDGPVPVNKQRQQQQQQADKIRKSAALRRCLHPVLVFPGTGGRPEHLTTNLTSFNLAACSGLSSGDSVGSGSGNDVSGSGSGSNSSSGNPYSSRAPVLEPGSCSVMLLLDPSCSYQLRLVPDLATPLTEVLLQRLHLLWAVAQAVLLLAICQAPAVTAAASSMLRVPVGTAAGRAPAAPTNTAATTVGMPDTGPTEANGPAAQGSDLMGATEDASTGGLRACMQPSTSLLQPLSVSVVHGLVSCVALLAVLQLPTMLQAVVQDEQGPLAPLASACQTAWLRLAQPLTQVIGGTAVVAACQAVDQALMVPVDQLGAFALLAPAACWAVGCRVSAAEHLLAVLLVTVAAAAARLVQAPVARAPAAAVLLPDELPLVVPCAICLLILLHIVLAMVSSLINSACFGLPRIGAKAVPRYRAAGAVGRSGLAGAGDAVQLAPPRDEGVPEASKQPQESNAARTLPLLQLSLFAAAAMVLHEQLLAALYLVPLLLAAYSRGRQCSAGQVAATVEARLMLLLVAVSTAVALPSLVAWSQYQGDIASAAQLGQGGGGAATRYTMGWGWARGLLATHHLVAAHPVSSTVSALDRLGPLLASTACLLVTWRLRRLSKSKEARSLQQGKVLSSAKGQALSSALRAVAVARLICTALGLDWAPYGVQALAAFLTCVRASLR